MVCFFFLIATGYNNILEIRHPSSGHLGIFLTGRSTHRELQTYPFWWPPSFSHPLLPGLSSQFPILLISYAEQFSSAPGSLPTLFSQSIFHIQTHQGTPWAQRISYLLRATLLRRQLCLKQHFLLLWKWILQGKANGNLCAIPACHPKEESTEYQNRHCLLEAPHYLLTALLWDDIWLEDP